jgi:hypothetical protein
MAKSKIKNDTSHSIQSTTKSPRYLSDDIVERYTSSEKDTDKKAIVREVYELLSADADAELETLSSLGSDMDKIYDKTALNVDQFIAQLIYKATTK